MNRRKLMTAFAGLGTVSLAGCANDDDETLDPDISETTQLGTADPVSLDREVDVADYDSQEFEEKATVTANVRVHNYIGSILRDRELLGAGIFLGIDYVSADEIDGEVAEGEFNRAKQLATVVNQRYVYNEDGELVTQPEPVELDTLREQLPRTVSVDVSSESGRYTAVLPVVVHRFWTYPDRA
ncbi:hypothetical protein OB955_17475 [Halobacteria archaeon AArc-m2/3/4]|uniref:Uncharacterized protein n=1 Tax=Natronoglomus mannanivorans TaxID=2979990 RepID=A0ABT2QHU4_9EURY|nr:hypothetical protein [Halobacteria archaeon AArc-m2/3/4]